MLDEFNIAIGSFNASDFSKSLEQIKVIEDKVLDTAAINRNQIFEKPIYSIIIVNYKSINRFTRLLIGLQPYQSDYRFEIIVVNNNNLNCNDIVFFNLTNFTLIELKFNYGCSGARNIGVSHSRGQFCIFLDDDGIFEDGAIEALIDTVEKNSAVTCRGKVIPYSKKGLSSPHYDKGDRLAYSIPDAEGISIWDRKIFIKFGGFQPLLSGHEGMFLCLKMYPFFGRHAFLYQPKAIFHHDFSDSHDAVEKKKKSYEINFNFLDHLGMDWRSLTRIFKLRDPFCFSPFFDTADISDKENFNINDSLSILTFGAVDDIYISSYITSLQLQTNQNFEVILVDCSCNASTLNALQDTELFRKSRLKIFKAKGKSIPECFQIAVREAKNDICVVHNIDDISVNIRFEKTLEYFESNKKSCMVSYCTFNEKEELYAEQFVTQLKSSIKARAFLCIPACFPTIAFKKAKISGQINLDIPFGFEYSWIYSLLRDKNFFGEMIPIPLVYFRPQKKMLYNKKRSDIRKIVIKAIILFHESFVGKLSVDQKKVIWLVSGWRKPTTPEQNKKSLAYLDYLLSCISVNERPHLAELIKVYSEKHLSLKD
jgi:glycosyltransferase involved in cell wall biosynthesis